jgi:long-chain acyl-CoA synthetase
MKHYLKRLENSIKSYWDNPALGNYGGETFTFGQIAAQIEKLHLFFKQNWYTKG